MLPWFNNDACPLYLAPMARYTDPVYRELCKERGADVMITEFVRADSIVHDVEEVWEGVDFTEAQRPMGVQIYGAIPENMAKAAQLIVERAQPDFIDLNFGCPADKITCKQAGSSMLRDLPLLRRVAESVVKALPDTPVTAKIRIGWDDEHIVAREAGQHLQDVGIQALTIHGRTKVQGYRGEAHWDVIGETAQAIDIPVIGNGNISHGEDVKCARDVYGVAGVMIGRAALGYPWIFRDIKHYLRTGETMLPPTLQERWDMLLRFTELTMARPFRQQRHTDIQWMRPKFMKLTKDMPGCKALRGVLSDVSTLDQLRTVAEEHMGRFGKDMRGSRLLTT